MAGHVPIGMALQAVRLLGEVQPGHPHRHTLGEAVHIGADPGTDPRRADGQGFVVHREVLPIICVPSVDAPPSDG
ncbi:hypothetical protein SDC9_160492 [bioreactor metagenome]|uniref:Uncharacterized protein n=1 Tax=bioreactor metagenome TaxID=1076179 RepID=A0A645FI22_9ZZZZ